MSRKPTISKEAEVLLKLLRINLGTETDLSFPSDVDWGKVAKLSYRHKVSAIAVDGFKAAGCTVGEQYRKAVDAWLANAAQTEWGYCYYVEVLGSLCRIFVDNGLTPIILKGYGLGFNYPRASHRGAGDIDIFLIDSEGRPATEKGVGIVENQLNIKTKKVPHDYEFDYKGIGVELHYDTTNAYWNTASEKYIVGRLTELLLGGCTPCPDIDGALLPGATFNALYLVRHTFGHFYTSSGNFRQYTDWLTFLQKHTREVDWELVGEELSKSGMKPFFEGFQTMLEEWLGLDRSLCPIGGSNSMVEEFAVRDMYGTVSNGRHLHERVRYYFRNREKLKFLSGEGWLALLLGSISASVRALDMRRILKCSKSSR